jgi:hypothetical protein
VSAAERVYQLLLRAYPLSFREAYGREMLLLVRDRRRDEGMAGARFWIAMVCDVTSSAPALWLDHWRSAPHNDTRYEEATMLAMAIMSILVGAMEMVNALTEGWFGGVVNRDGQSLAAGTMGAVAGALLLTAGIALLRRTPHATSLARAAAVTCLGVFALAALAMPRMSIFATALGIVYPVLLLAALQWTTGRRHREPRMA